MPESVFVADIGGTNARFALAEYDGDTLALRRVQHYRAEDHESVLGAADAYLQTISEKPVAACFAVAGPVTGEVIEFTNSPWVLDVKQAMTALSLKRFDVVNDFEALGYGVRRLQPEDTVTIKDGAPDSNAPILVIGPGTGFGQSLIVPCNGGDKVVATEGGHAAFAPQTDEERAVLKFIAHEYEHVSVERLLSGRGLVNLHRALCAINNTTPFSLEANEITKAALAGKHPIARKTVGLFCEVLGSVAGDAVLATGARGGVVLGGGILPKIRDLFLASRFSDRFCDKERMQGYLEAVPVDLIVCEDTALIGAGVVSSLRNQER